MAQSKQKLWRAIDFTFEKICWFHSTASPERRIIINCIHLCGNPNRCKVMKAEPSRQICGKLAANLELLTVCAYLMLNNCEVEYKWKRLSCKDKIKAVKFFWPETNDEHSPNLNIKHYFKSFRCNGYCSWWFSKFDAFCCDSLCYYTFLLFRYMLTVCFMINFCFAAVSYKWNFSVGIETGRRGSRIIWTY